MSTEVLAVLPTIRSILIEKGFRRQSSDGLAELAKWLAFEMKTTWRIILFIFNSALTNGKPGYNYDCGKNSMSKLAKVAARLAQNGIDLTRLA